MDTAITSIVVIIAALGTAGIVSAIGFSTPVHGQATHAQGGTCTPFRTIGDIIALKNLIDTAGIWASSHLV